jgi:hypothetical protein
MKWLVLGIAALVSNAYAQKEQWLEYHMLTQASSARGYRYLDVTTNVPAGLALPKLNAQPYFVRWTTPLDPSGGRWLCFDRSRKTGPYDRVYVDTKGDGKLDGQSPLSSTSTDQLSSTSGGDAYYTHFGPAKLVFKGEDGPTTYHIHFIFMRISPTDTRMLVESGGYYAGNVDIGGKKRHVELMDVNVNGAFNDQGTDLRNSDAIELQGDKLPRHALGKLLEFDGQYYRLEIARDGAFIKLQKAEDLEFGQLKVPETITELTVLGSNGHFIRKPVKGQLSLPAGQYAVQEWNISRKDAKNVTWQLQGSNFKSNNPALFEIVAGKPATIQIGEPFRLGLRANESSSPNIGFNLDFLGSYGESVQLEKGNANPPGPKLSLVSLKGTYRSTNTFEFG